jgi:hypothetical protein
MSAVEVTVATARKQTLLTTPLEVAIAPFPDSRLQAANVAIPIHCDRSKIVRTAEQTCDQVVWDDGRNTREGQAAARLPLFPAAYDQAITGGRFATSFA